jgi:hypothetical protein
VYKTTGYDLPFIKHGNQIPAPKPRDLLDIEMPAVKDKSKADRLKETIRLLKELGRIGYSDVDIGYNDVKALLTEWVNDGEKRDAEIDFPRYNRKAIVSLPKREDRAATIQLKVIA